MHAGWHLLLDDYLERCFEAFECNSLDGVDDLESALQEQLQSQVGNQLAKCSCSMYPYTILNTLCFFLYTILHVV